jgi:ubiquinone/menaquinone biosynthesis C-methylase UbiE
MVDAAAPRSWNPFRVPAGPLGHLAGWIMGRDDAAHREVADLLNPQPGARVGEIGYGPGQLVAVLAARDPHLQVCGVDPSPVMLRQARRRLARAGVAGRVDLRLGAAGALPFPDASLDHVVAVNTAALWPDLTAAAADAHRVLRPGGSFLIAWHSTTSPVGIQRRLAQPEHWWQEVTAVLQRLFGNAERHDLIHTTACRAVLSARTGVLDDA